MDIHVDGYTLKDKSRAGEIACLLKYLLGKPEGLSSMSRACKKAGYSGTHLYLSVRDAETTG